LFPLGHVGIGTHLIPRALRARLPWRWLALGCLLPDLIDKPIWILTQSFGAESRLYDSARMVGHTAFLAVAVAIAARLVGARQLAALAYAIPTHLFLDVVTDAGMGGGWGVWKSWLFWPFEIPHIGILMVGSPVQDLAMELHSRFYFAGELVGAALLFWDLARNRSKRAE
jgi:hypothetical protein